MKINSSSLLICVAALFLAACGDTSSTSPPVPKVNNVSEKRIFLKDLTTGIRYESKNFPKPVVKLDSLVSFNYEFFGATQLITAKLNSEKIITAYEILLNSNQDAMKSAIEEKLTSENGKIVKFDCVITKSTYGGINWEQKDCVIKSGEQKLLIQENRPLNQKPASADYSTWQSMHMSKLLLSENIQLSLEERERVAKQILANEKVIAEKKAKAKKDI